MGKMCKNNVKKISARVDFETKVHDNLDEFLKAI